MPIDKGNGTQSWAIVLLPKSNSETQRYTVENECIVNLTDASIFYQHMVFRDDDYAESCSSRADRPTDSRETREQPTLDSWGGGPYQENLRPRTWFAHQPTT
jgi:hypothetical protein